MADPMEKATGKGGSTVVTEFEIPGEPTGGPYVLGGLGIGNKQNAIRVKVMADGSVEYWRHFEGKEPARVVPTPGERAMVEQELRSRREVQKEADKAKPSPVDKLEDVKDPVTGAVVKKRDPSTGTVIDLPNPPPPQTKNAARIEAANATVAEANAAKIAAPEMITRSPGPTPGTNAAVDDPRSVTAERVTVTQDTSDRGWAAENRAAQAAVLARAQQEEAATISKARLAVEQGQLSAQQARDKVNEELERIRLSLSAESNAISKRGQDVSMRNTDVSAGVSQRGQDLDHERGMVQSAASLQAALLPYTNAPGQVQSTNSLMSGGPPVPTTPVGMPFDPQQFVLDAATAARAKLPPQFVLPGSAPQPAPTPYSLPG